MSDNCMKPYLNEPDTNKVIRRVRQKYQTARLRMADRDGDLWHIVRNERGRLADGNYDYASDVPISRKFPNPDDAWRDAERRIAVDAEKATS